MIDLHALAAMPGAGKAQDELKKAGYWDESKAPVGEGRHEYKVEVTGSYDPKEETVTVSVYANSRDEAEELAADEVDFDDVYSVRIISIKEDNA